MQNFLRILTALSLGSVLNAPAVLAQSNDEIGADYQRWVEYRDGEVSFDFDHAPAAFALNVIHAQTGLKIVVPPAAEARLVNLRLSRSPLEPAVRSLIASIGLKNFALMYDEAGRPSTAVVVDTAEETETATATVGAAAEEKPATATKLLTADERKRLHTDLDRWNELKQEERLQIETRLKALPATGERDQLLKEYGRQLLQIRN
jgi:hypothetical protein